MLRPKLERPEASSEYPKASRLYAQNRKQISTLKDSIRYHNVVDTMATVWKEEGLLGFFKGMKMRMLISSVSSGVGWGTYHLVKNTLQPPAH